MKERLKQLFAPIDLTRGSIFKVIIVFMIPIMISYFFQQIYTLTDAVIVGQNLSGSVDVRITKVGGDTTLGTGMVVIGLASLVIGEVLTGRRGGVAGGVAACVLGSVVYRIITALALTSRLGAVNLKLVSAVIVAAAISYPAAAEKIKLAQKRRKAGRHA